MNDHTTDHETGADAETEAETRIRPEDIHPEIPLGDLSRDLTPVEIEDILSAHPNTILHISYSRMTNFAAANTYELLVEAYANLTPEPLQPARHTFTQAAGTFIDAARQPVASVLTHDLHTPLAERARLRTSLGHDVSIAAASADAAAADAARRAQLILNLYRTDSRAIGTETRAIRKTVRELSAPAFAQYLDLLPISKAILPRLAAANEEAHRIFDRRMIEVSTRVTGLTRARRAAADTAAAALASDINAYLRFNIFPGCEAVVRAANIAIIEAIHTMRRRAAHHHRKGGEAAPISE